MEDDMNKILEQAIKDGNLEYDSLIGKNEQELKELAKYLKERFSYG